jgi:hypothetical protein
MKVDNLVTLFPFVAMNCEIAIVAMPFFCCNSAYPPPANFCCQRTCIEKRCWDDCTPYAVSYTAGEVHPGQSCGNGLCAAPPP